MKKLRRVIGLTVYILALPFAVVAIFAEMLCNRIDPQ